MQEKRPNLISKIINKFSKSNNVEVVQTDKKRIEISSEQICQEYYDEKIAMETREKLERVNTELWLSGLGG